MFKDTTIANRICKSLQLKKIRIDFDGVEVGCGQNSSIYCLF